MNVSLRSSQVRDSRVELRTVPTRGVTQLTFDVGQIAGIELILVGLPLLNPGVGLSGLI